MELLVQVPPLKYLWLHQSHLRHPLDRIFSLHPHRDLPFSSQRLHPLQRHHHRDDLPFYLHHDDHHLPFYLHHDDHHLPFYLHHDDHHHHLLYLHHGVLHHDDHG